MMKLDKMVREHKVVVAFVNKLLANTAPQNPQLPKWRNQIPGVFEERHRD
jgi:hypothetical protein